MHVYFMSKHTKKRHTQVRWPGQSSVKVGTSCPRRVRSLLVTLIKSKMDRWGVTECLVELRVMEGLMGNGPRADTHTFLMMGDDVMPGKHRPST